MPVLRSHLLRRRQPGVPPKIQGAALILLRRGGTEVFATGRIKPYDAWVFLQTARAAVGSQENKGARLTAFAQTVPLPRTAPLEELFAHLPGTPVWPPGTSSLTKLLKACAFSLSLSLHFAFSVFREFVGSLMLHFTLIRHLSLSPGELHASQGSGPHPWVTLGYLLGDIHGGHDWGAPGITWGGQGCWSPPPPPTHTQGPGQSGLSSAGRETRSRAMDLKCVPRPAASAPLGGRVAMLILQPRPQPECGSTVPVPGWRPCSSLSAGVAGPGHAQREAQLVPGGRGLPSQWLFTLV